ncbi:G-type lectin S-receptor-like serine/threonine-protein kinase SD1-13 [Glycine max]|nr:G-type lectin S-receptor-like serine/threonine-protein kinase SD1-13 [Glycine max]
MKLSPFLIFAWLCLRTTTHATTARDSLRPGEMLNNSSILTSAQKKFSLKFATIEIPNTSLNTYLVIDRANTTGNVDWIGNRNDPLAYNSCALTLNHSGALIITRHNGDSIVLYSPAEATNRTIATLLDSGNFVLKEIDGNGSTKNVLWQSFDHPEFVLLPGMKLGVNKKSGMSWLVKASISRAKPASGSFTLEWEPREGQLVIKRQGQVYWASGLLRNKRFEHIPEEVQLMYEYNIVSSEEEESFSYTTPNGVSQWVLFHNGQLKDTTRGSEIARADTCYGYNTDGGCQRWEQPTCRKKSDQRDMKKSIRVHFAAAVASLVIVITSIGIFYIILRRRKSALKDNTTRTENKMLKLVALDRYAVSKHHCEVKKRSDSRVFSYASIIAMTNRFSVENKLGEGGFGLVYKGKLPTGEDVAIKRLSKDRTRKMLLDWKRRFNIIEGIAQGLLYLHKYSRLKVVHRDLKASNILLDENMNPKISDFGTARIFSPQESEINTERIVGTYGYMSPEYVTRGIFSIKSDVYSFGVLILEIVSGGRTNSFYSGERQCNLIGHAWELWQQGKGLELVDPTIRDSCIEDQALRCIHVGLLCAEDNAVDRPTISDIINMLTSEYAPFPLPRRPAFYSRRMPNEECRCTKGSECYSVNGLSISNVVAR